MYVIFSVCRLCYLVLSQAFIVIAKPYLPMVRRNWKFDASWTNSYLLCHSIQCFLLLLSYSNTTYSNTSSLSTRERDPMFVFMMTVMPDSPQR